MSWVKEERKYELRMFSQSGSVLTLPVSEVATEHFDYACKIQRNLPPPMFGRMNSMMGLRLIFVILFSKAHRNGQKRLLVEGVPIGRKITEKIIHVPLLQCRMFAT